MTAFQKRCWIIEGGGHDGYDYDDDDDDDDETTTRTIARTTCITVLFRVGKCRTTTFAQYLIDFP